MAIVAWRLVAAAEGVEQALHERGLDGRAGVADLDDYGVGFAGGTYPHVRVLGAMLERIRDEVRQQL